MTAIVRARTPADLLVLLPYQLGYHPLRSVVVVMLHGRRLGLVQRLDLTRGEEISRAAADVLLDVAERERPDSVVVVGFEDHEGDSDDLRAAVVGEARRRGVRVAEHLVVRDGRWYAPDCDEACCPTGGEPLPAPDGVPGVAEYVRRGIAPLPSRDHVLESLVPIQEAESAAATAAALARRHDQPGWPSTVSTTRVWRTILDLDPAARPVTALPPEAVAVALASLRQIGWRDALLGVLCPGAVPTEALEQDAVSRAREAAAACPWVQAEPSPPASDQPADRGTGQPADRAAGDDLAMVLRHRLADLLRLTPEAESAPLLTVLAHVAWWQGDGTVAGACLDEALAVEPEHRLAGLMLRLLQHGLRPPGWSSGSTGPDEGG